VALSSSGSLAILVAIRRASSFVSRFIVMRRPVLSRMQKLSVISSTRHGAESDDQLGWAAWVRVSAESLSFPARRAGWAILGRGCSRERLVLISGTIVEANSQPQQDDLRRLTVDESRIECWPTIKCDAQAGHPISQLRAAGGMQRRNLDEADR
jgi:hypothetical protein